MTQFITLEREKCKGDPIWTYFTPSKNQIVFFFPRDVHLWDFFRGMHRNTLYAHVYIHTLSDINIYANLYTYVHGVEGKKSSVPEEK